MTTQQPTLDSREVARMIGKSHGNLMRDIAKYVRAIDKPSQSKNGSADDEDFSQINFDSAKQDDSNGLNFEPAENDRFHTWGENEIGALTSDESQNDSDDDEDLGIQAGKSLEYFVPSFYADAQGKTRPCYLCAKKGCDLIANKLTGDKGIRFTVEYIERFEEMTKQLQQFIPYAATRQTIGETAKLLREARLIAKEGGISLAQSIAGATEYLQAKGEPFPDTMARLLLEKEATEQLQPKQLVMFGC